MAGDFESAGLPLELSISKTNLAEHSEILHSLRLLRINFLKVLRSGSIPAA